MRADHTRILWDVDTQADFCDSSGRLFVPGADDPALRRRWSALVDWAHRTGLPHWASADAHQHSDPEISDTPDYRITFPEHCMHGSEGALKVADTSFLAHSPLVLGPNGSPAGDHLGGLLAAHRNVLVLKNTLSPATTPGVMDALQAAGVREVVLFGLVSEFCVDAAVQMFLGLGADITVVQDAIVALDEARAAAACEQWLRSGAVRLTSTRTLVGDQAWLRD